MRGRKRVGDVMTRSQRSRCMSHIRSRDTGPEMLVRKALWGAGLRYRLHARLPGRPDVAFMASRVAVFVDGCFWHCCPVHRTQPKGHAGFWSEKLRSNVARDRAVAVRLKQMGWAMVRVWEHEATGSLRQVVYRVRRLVRTRTRTAKLRCREARVGRAPAKPGAAIPR
jgi:DNA mismatch endonuclease (patch repair protein)